MKIAISLNHSLGRVCCALLCMMAGSGAWLLAESTATAEEGAPPAGEVDYTRDIATLLSNKCYDCHSASNAESDLRLDSVSLAIAGGYSGPAIVPGNAAESLLLEKVTTEDEDLRMPPADYGAPLSAEEIALLQAWIEAGAPHPQEDQVAEGSTADGASDHWAFQPVARPELPTVSDEAWCQTPIDRLILARLDSEGLTPSAEADRVTLLRRVSLDLIGLPPTLEETETFLADTEAGAYERLVDRLLASPHYGERWGRQWLDQARYADSDGYTNDKARSIWLYRDWVVDAYNRNLPFDDFIIDQLAGDLRPNATQRQIVATGFHRNTQRNTEGGSDEEQYRVERIADRTSTTATVFLGLTMGCARCHDHKFDPITQADYYQLYAFFNSSNEPNLNAHSPLDLNDQGEPREGAQRHQTMVIRERNDPRETHIHIRGDFLSPGREVSPATPAALPAIATEGNEANQATRLDLAHWIATNENPLTARVAVNRIWQVYFGRGIVLTENDFGTQGQLPSHPELLDWLAAEFMESGWDVKMLHRLIVTSAVYRQSSHQSEIHRERDPYNTLLARQSRHRLEAELIRDAALTASGLLSRRIGGPGVYPPQPDGVMLLSRDASRVWNTSRGNNRYRRGLYTYFWRSTPFPFLKAFDAPDSNTTCTRRHRSNTPIAALTTLNDSMFIETAVALATRVLTEVEVVGEPPQDGSSNEQTDDARLRYAFRLCVTREPSEDELAILRQTLSAERLAAEPLEEAESFPISNAIPSEIAAEEWAAWLSISRVLLNLDEFITRE